MEKLYSDERNAQVIVSLLKKHGIRKVIASPGTTNMAVVVSMKRDSFFEMYSSVDERSAAYMACGLSQESGEPVVISCTGATASRNYLPGLTEAYYRKLPILAVTSTQAMSRVGHHVAQVIDRSVMPKDVTRFSVTLPIVKDDDDLKDCEIKVNTAILELTRHGGGPAHINLPTSYSKTYSTKKLPSYRFIQRITESNDYPELTGDKIAVLIGSHKVVSDEETIIIDKFCASTGAVVFCDHTSNYKGKYRIIYTLGACQRTLCSPANDGLDVLIHIGEVTGDYYTQRIKAKQVWRVSEDGQIRDTFGSLRYIFEMTEKLFFQSYTTENSFRDPDKNLEKYKNHLTTLYAKIPEIPFGNIWIASQLSNKIPDGSTIHFGILNSLRSWNFFELPKNVKSASNVGGFGIDGNVSSLIGASLTNVDKLYFGVIGDLAFFYDMNSIGNRHVGKNLRLLIVNNGKGTEFRQFNHYAADFGESADEFIAAGGHYGNKSKSLIKEYAGSLGFEYISAESKEEFDQVYSKFLNPKIGNAPMLFEIFTNSSEESKALEIMMTLEEDTSTKAKNMAKQMLGKKGIDTLKKVIGK